MTEPWPKDGASFRASVAILRPLYEVMLTEISLDMKTRVYQVSRSICKEREVLKACPGLDTISCDSWSTPCQIMDSYHGRRACE
jgi:hypothetical protein